MSNAFPKWYLKSEPDFQGLKARCYQECSSPGGESGSVLAFLAPWLIGALPASLKPERTGGLPLTTSSQLSLAFLPLDLEDPVVDIYTLK